MSDLHLRFTRPFTATAAGVILIAVSGCAGRGDIDDSGGVVQVRSACPSVAIAAGTGDVTLFNAPQATEAEAIDLTAAITNLRSKCDDSQDQIYTEVSFDVIARRNDKGAARAVTLPYYSAVVRGGTAVTAKRVGQVTLNFAAGEDRARASAKAGSYVDKAAATLPDDIRQRITRRREAGDVDAATDPLSEPTVKAALERISFEQLVGFNLSAEQLKYNMTR